MKPPSEGVTINRQETQPDGTKAISRCDHINRVQPVGMEDDKSGSSKHEREKGCM
jgi:hypothetical protein